MTARGTTVHVTLAERRVPATRLVEQLLAAMGEPAIGCEIVRRCTVCGDAHGKPYLTGRPEQVSFSYAGNLVAAAITLAGPVGIDIERDAATAFRGFADVALAAEEAAGPLRDRARTWTRKEAVLKASGIGLSQDPRTLVVSAPDAPPRSVSGTRAPVQLLDVAAPDGYACSVAVLTDDPITVHLVSAVEGG